MLFRLASTLIVSVGTCLLAACSVVAMTPTPTLAPAGTPRVDVITNRTSFDGRALTPRVSISDASPAQNATVTVTGKLVDPSGQAVRHVLMHTLWHFQGPSVTCEAKTDANGLARCARQIGKQPVGFRVVIEVSFVVAGTTYQTMTAFTPRRPAG